uniref:Reverse transcriptase domain-containing protein n=1 Tax=Tanacetum cinerariifolium TaxID=118510 RepID=A0A699HK07_TANCI|nr:reverse transcriptase domain-containing protein [Tanacetum cinerariifolium]
MILGMYDRCLIKILGERCDELGGEVSEANIKAVKEICVTCGGAHPYYQCLAAGGNTFPEFRDNIQGFSQPNVQNNQNRFGQPQGFNRATNFNQEQPYQATAQSNQNFHFNELEKIKRINDVSLKAMQNQIDMVRNKLRNEMKTSIQTSLSNETNEIKNMMASLLQINTASTSGSGSLPGNTVANPKGKLKAIATRNGLATDGPIVSTPPKSVTLEEDECIEEAYTDPYLADELKCKALADLGASINLMPLSISKKLGLPDLILTQMTLELANRAICTPDEITRDVFIPVGKLTFTADFVVVDYESDPRVPLILGRPFLRTARALIDVHGEEMILRDRDERLAMNMKHDTASYSNHPHRDSVNLINIFNILSEDCLEDLVSIKQSGNPTFSLHKEIASPKVTHVIYDSKGCNFLSEELPDINSFNDIHPHFYDDLLSGSTTYSANSLLEEFADELALITYPLDYDDNYTYSIDQSDLANLDDLFVDTIPEMFTDEQPPDYSFPPRFDVYPDDFLEIESDADNFDDDSFDSKGEKIKESELLIEQLDLSCDILSEYDSFNSQDFSRDDDLPSLDTEDKVKEYQKRTKLDQNRTKREAVEKSPVTPSASNSQNSVETQSLVISTDVEEESRDLNVAHMNNDLFFGIPILENDSKSSSLDVIPTVVHTAAPNSEHVIKWTKDHPLDNIIDEFERPVSTRVQLMNKPYFITTTLFHFIEEQVKNRVLELYFFNTEYQLADIFTKALSRERIEFLINKLGMRSFTPETLKQLAYEAEE